AVEARPGGAEGTWIAAAGFVAVTYLAILARAWLGRAGAPGPGSTAAAALAGLAFAGFALHLTEDTQALLRAALVGGAGAAEVALGAAVAGRDRARATTLLGAALALLAGAAAFLFSGATITVVWAAMACATAVLAARERDPWWLGGAIALFAAALVRLAAFDALAVERARELFLSSAGAEGRLGPLLLLNPRALALAATALALLLAARAAARAGEGWRVAAGGLATVGWTLAVMLAVTEARDLVLTLPATPPPGDRAAFAALRQAVGSARLEQEAALSATTSLVMAACAALLVAGGFVFRDALQRWLGLALFGMVLGKLLLADVWRLSRLLQVAVFVGVGVLLLAAAFLYARFGKRIAALLREGPPGGALLVLLAAGLAFPARALDPSPFRVVREIGGVERAGLHALEVDPVLLRESRAPGATLGDVRIRDAGGAEVPWALRLVGGEPAERTVEGKVIDPVVLPDGAVRAVVDLGPSPPRHGELRLDLEGKEFLRAVRLEVSDDGRRYGLLAEGARVWSIAGGGDARRTAVRHPLSEARYARVTLLPGAGDPPRIVGARAAPGDAPEPSYRTLPAQALPAKRSPDGRETLLDLDLGAPGLPVESLALEVATPAFERRVRVLAGPDGAHWTPVGGGVVWRALPGEAGAAAEGLRLAAEGGGRRFLRLAIADGDSPPLQVTAVHPGWRPRELVFQAAAAGAHQLLVGADVARPAYDLAGLLARNGAAPAAPARLGPERPNPAFHEGAPALPFSERHRGALAAGLAVLLGVLALWAVRLLRGGGPAAPGGTG
ncbi:MAG TPA: DUF2339 domain-containing protein, partial [Anaeromyxobacter sp.]|nr:DUF2339 domain-containing protein [Anaeromyxobacter sp.]